MRTTSVLRVGAVLGALMLCGLMAAERRSPLIGSTREQVRAKLGEPKSNIVAGAREVLIYPQERIVLRDGVVVEVDALYELSTPKAAAPETAAAPTPAAEGNVQNRDETSPFQQTAPAGSAQAVDTPPVEAAPTPVAVPEVTIKSVRPPSRNGAAAVSTRAAPAAVSRPVAAASGGERSPPATVNSGGPGTPPPGSVSGDVLTSEPRAESKSGTPANTPPATVPAPVVTSAPVAPPALVVENAVPSRAEGAEMTTPPTSAEPAAAVAHVAMTPADAPETVPAAKAPVAPASEPAVETTNRTPYIFGGMALVLVGLLAWAFRQRRQRSLLLEATAVSHPPFSNTVLAHAPSSRFTLDLLQKLEWKRFEELVCAYYNKTGVLAVRTKAGRQNPVHVRISWKGEQRPFACVHCIAHAPMAVDQRPIEALHGALAIEDVRRGYVVTSGKFAPAAREFAEEKQITLLPGEIFVEKLNALPDAARTELLKDVMTGDYATPSCPTCESKMAKSASDPLVWECTQCGTSMR